MGLEGRQRAIAQPWPRWVGRGTLHAYVVTGVASNLGTKSVYALAVCLTLDPWPTEFPTSHCRWVAQEDEDPATVELFDLSAIQPSEARYFHILLPEIPDDWRGTMAFSIGSVLLLPPPGQ